MLRTPRYGPGNPHLLSTLKTGLVGGNYDEYDNRQEVNVPRCALPKLPAWKVSRIHPVSGG